MPIFVLPKLIRLRDAPEYLGVNINFFNKHIRPALTELPLGQQMIAFFRDELDDWATAYKEEHGKKPLNNVKWPKSNTSSSKIAKQKNEDAFNTALKKSGVKVTKEGDFNG